MFIVLDLAFSFWRNYRLPLDGDLAATVLPAPWFAQVLHDPFGWAVLTRNEVYSATNRFFAHAAMGLYWKTMPRLLQQVLDPVSSLYVASALFTTLTQAGLLLLLARYIQLASGARRTHFWLIAALLVPLFQTAGGYYEQMGITDRAVTYTFFYAFAMLLLLVLLWPFYQAACRQQPLRLPWWRALLLVGLMVVVAFNGPIATATIAVLLLGVGGHWAWGQGQRWRQGLAWPTLGRGWLSGQAVLLLGTLTALCLYSIYIGRNNVENTHTYSLLQRYQLLPLGVARYFIYQLGLPVLVLVLASNFLLACWAVTDSMARRRVLTTLGWVGLFIGAYLLLLPLGGYRSYRPNLLRNDTALPILLGLLFAYGYSSYFLLSQLRGRLRGGYLLIICLVGGFFLHADGQPDAFPVSDCERWSLDQLARAREPVVELAGFCPVLAWMPISDYTQSEVQAQMLYYWHITPTKKLYFQK
ncbi:hypothetical protein [Hymenobacter sp. UV11]|uniref:hypothetical protein n=1 Tax=Hymenobacter sp. UV11 TaxID=1849735 RepID=UPI00105D12E8|nr:hypothetical protein [Hymenobacter sp. UV11]TDN36582.1 hypothetical protein A8B98_07770 [Hymenobacter sp. UV11]